MKQIILLIAAGIFFSLTAAAQSEILTNDDIIQMSEAGLNKELIIEKIKSTGSNFDISAKALIALKKGSVTDEIISLIVERSKTQPEKISEVVAANGSKIIEKKNLTGADLLRSARTIAIHKDTINPSRQALEKELLKRPEWKKINLSITENRANADLSIQISFVHFSVVTHRYVYRVYDTRSGMVIAAGETTSWGSLAKNLARNITKSLDKALEN